MCWGMIEDLKVFPLMQYEAEIGEENLRFFLSGFSCPKNLEVEDFLRNKARQSAHRSSSATYLVCSNKHKELLGYFTIMTKAYSVNGKSLNSANRRLIERFAEPDANGNYHAAVYLIAQIGKNFTIPAERRIEGHDLLALAIEKFEIAKNVLGGKLVMVEREADRPKLLEFYNDNGFKSWTTRRNAKDGMVYDQMFAVLNGK